MKAVFVLVLFPFFLSAQSEFFNNSVLGFKADYFFSLNEDFISVGGNFGISYSNVIDIGFEYTKKSYKRESEIESYGRMVFAAYNFRSDNNYLKVLLGYSHNSINIRKFKFPMLEVTGPLLGVKVSPKIYENNSIGLFPGLSFSMVFLSQSSRMDDGRNHNINLGLEFNVVPKINKQFYFVFTPSISKSLSHSEIPLIFGINLGLLFNFQKKGYTNEKSTY